MNKFTTWKERSIRPPMISKIIFSEINPGVLIGRKGENIQKMEQESKCKIRIIRDENKIIISSFKEENVTNGINIVNKVIENYKNRINDKLQNLNISRYDYKNNHFLEEHNFCPIEDNNIKDDNFLGEHNFPQIGNCVNNNVKKNGVWGKKSHNKVIN